MVVELTKEEIVNGIWKRSRHFETPPTETEVYDELRTYLRSLQENGYKDMYGLEVPDKLLLSDTYVSTDTISGKRYRTFTREQVLDEVVLKALGGYDIRLVNSNDSARCDYCKCHIKTQLHHYCYDCNAVMCQGCFTSEDSEMVVKWMDTLKRCRTEHDVDKRWYPDFTCNLCKNNIPVDDNKYENREDDLDYHQACFEKNRGTIEDNVVQINGKKFAENNTHFGSLLDWIPLFTDKPSDLVLACANPENQFYNRLALSCFDNHGRLGIFTCSKMDDAQTLLNELCSIEKYEKDDNEKDANEEEEDDDEDDDEEAGPIRRMMRKRKMPVYFG